MTSPRPEALPATDWAAAMRPALERYLRALGAQAAEVDDLAQETLLVACSRAAPEGPDTRAAWLRGIARNLWLRSRRWWRRRREREVAAAVEELWVAEAGRDGGTGLLARLRDCLERLQPRARQALQMQYGDGDDRRAIAAAVGLRPNGLKTMMQRARAVLRECIERGAT